MKSDILNLKALFQRDIRYIIPTFQRPYVWNQEDQWEPLWNDVRNTSEEYLDELGRADGNQAAAEERVGAHFLGAVVLQQQPTATAELETRHVIDGQQRLTTLQLLLDAAQDVFEQDGFSKEARQLRKLVLNDEDFAEDDRDLVFKVWPTLGDREGFRRAMANELVVDGYEDDKIVQAHAFFKLQIRSWLEASKEQSLVRAHALSSTLMGLLRMVVIDLESRDDANVIFETLNARGTPLLASDLIKNWIFHTAAQGGLDSEAIHRKYWTGFEDFWWRAEIRQGRLFRPRLDVYLNYWLIMRTAEEVQSADVFPRFRKYAETVADVTTLLDDLQTVATAFKALDQTSGSSSLDAFLYRWSVMDAGVSSPVILWLLANRTEIGEARFHRTLAAVESYLVRRMVCRLTTKDYNRLFLDLMGKIKQAPIVGVDDLVVEYLASQTSESRAWPSNGQVHEALLSLPLYTLLTRGRLRLILEGLEDSFRSPKSEEEHVRRGLTIEHVMPQGWRKHWQPTLLTEAEAACRDRVIHTLGNLTLVNDRLNPTLSNAPWSEKTIVFRDHTVLQLNTRLLSEFAAEWSETTIQQRGEALAKQVLGLWPRP